MATVHPEPVSEDFSVVMLGSFNPAIFHPEWFVRHKLVGESALEDTKLTVVSQPAADFVINNVKLSCTDTRLMLAVSNMAHVELLIDALNGMLKLLTHLPITAVGCNNEAVYKIPTEEGWHKIGHTLAPKDPVWNKICKNPGMHALSIQAQVDWTHPLLETIVIEPILVKTPHHPAIRIKTNLHFQFPPIVPITGKTGAEYVSIYLEHWWKHCSARTREVADKIFTEISYE